MALLFFYNKDNMMANKKQKLAQQVSRESRKARKELKTKSKYTRWTDYI